MFDNSLELTKFIPYKDRVKLLMRVATPNSGARFELSSKFGLSHDEAPELLKQAKELQLKVVGFSFHVGSQSGSVGAYVTAVEAILELFPIAKELGHEMKILDIGGGFPFDYESGYLDFFEFCEPLREILETVDKDVKIHAEPGRFLSTTCMTLVHTVVGAANRNGERWYYMDEGSFGVYASLIDAVDYPISTPYNHGELIKSALTGPTCSA